MLNHSKRAVAVTQEVLAKNLVSVDRSYAKGAIIFDRTLDGVTSLVPYFVVDWENLKVNITLDKDQRGTNSREQAGFETWQRAGVPSDFLQDWIEKYDGSPEMGSRRHHEKKGAAKAQSIIVESGREAQKILNSTEGKEEVDVKAAVIAALNG